MFEGWEDHGSEGGHRGRDQEDDQVDRRPDGHREAGTGKSIFCSKLSILDLIVIKLGIT